MDEAERCHRLGFIAYGQLLGHGTPAELQAGSGLAARVLSGPKAAALAPALEQEHAVSTVTRMGDELRVTGEDGEELDRALAHRAPGVKAQASEPSLEEVFIHLSRQASDNMA
jgi:ABC-2 type transport system ATP-binding protein